MASTSEIAKRYFACLDAHELDAAMAHWAPGGVGRLLGRELAAPEQVREYFASVFAAFPDFRLEVLETTAARNRTAVRWRATGTFAGPAGFEGFQPNGARVQLEGCDVITVADELIQENNAYLDGSDMARQLGVLPAVGSRAEARMTRLVNLRSRLQRMISGGRPERVAQGVWLVRGGLPVRTMNVYLIEEEAGVTVFDAGVASMTGAVAAAAARLGGIRRVVLGHADADHRGVASGLGAPVYCHPAERHAAQQDTPLRPYFDFSKLGPHGRLLYPRLLYAWDGGAVDIAGTVEEGEEMAGFRVIELPGHAPGLIGLFRESDRLALGSDCVYTVDPQTGLRRAPGVPHRAFNADDAQARESIRRLAELEPSVAWFGHAGPVRGDVATQLRRAADA